MNRSNANLLNDIRTNRDFLLTILDQPIVFHRVYKKITGSVTAALMLSYATQVSEEIEPARGGWFSLDADTWEEETGLTRKEQINARRRLRDLALLEERKQGMPAFLEFKVNFHSIAVLLHEYAQTLPSAGNNAHKRAKSRRPTLAA